MLQEAGERGGGSHLEPFPKGSRRLRGSFRLLLLCIFGFAG